MDTTFAFDTATHPETGETFATHVAAYSDGTVITSVWPIPATEATRPTSWRGQVAKVGSRWLVGDPAGMFYPVTFRTKSEALADTIGLALDTYDLATR